MQSGSPRRRFWRRLFLLVLGLFVAVVALVLARCVYVFRDRHPGYQLALDVDPAPAAATPRPLQVGFGRVPINPDLSDPTNHPVWLAGFSNHRAATSQHDSLWATAIVIDDGYHRLGLVALDAIGFFHDDVIAVRELLAPELRLTYTVVCSTHNHSTPDLMGLWGPDIFHTGVDPAYRRLVIRAAAEALGQAVKTLEPARMAAHEIPVSPEGLLADTRKPVVFDPDLRALHFTRPGTGATIGTLVAWADHPETPWGRNTEITSDFCGYLRDALERGVTIDGRRYAEGLGGIHVYVNGAIGGLMTTSPSVTVRDPYLNQEFKQPSHEKARAVGHQLAARLLPLLHTNNPAATDHVPIGLRARTIELPLDNLGFLAAPVLGLLDRGHVRWQAMRSEVALVTLGDVSLGCLPGEVYPELVNGGIERATGGDFDIDPVEVPSFRALMPGRIKFIVGLANDEVGYIIPKSEWDRKPPYLYGSEHGVYGEVNSVGPETAVRLHRVFGELTQPRR